MRLLISVLIATIFAIPALAGEFFVIEAGDKLMKSGQGQDTIKIKQMLKQQHNLDLQEAELLSVMMVAKTRQGKGKAHLRVGQNVSANESFSGNIAKFNSTNDKSFDRHLFLNPKNNSQGVWQMQLQGNFKVRQLVVEIGPQETDLKLDYSHSLMKSGQGQDTLYLRTKAKNQYGINPQDYELNGITLIAKTRNGNGKAQLKVGNNFSEVQTVNGKPSDFNDNSEWTYYKYEFDNPKENSQGVWQVKLKGNFKIQEVVLHITKK